MKVIIIILIIILLLALAVMRKIWKLYRETARVSVNKTEEMSHIIEIYGIWLRLTRDGSSIARFLKRSGIKNIALCAMTDIGAVLFRDLKSEGMNIVCIIDPGDVKLPDVRCVSLEEKRVEGVDMVIITDPFRYDELREKLVKTGYDKIDSIDGILYGMLKDQAENGD